METIHGDFAARNCRYVVVAIRHFHFFLAEIPMPF